MMVAPSSAVPTVEAAAVTPLVSVASWSGSASTHSRILSGAWLSASTDPMTGRVVRSLTARGRSCCTVLAWSTVEGEEGGDAADGDRGEPRRRTAPRRTRAERRVQCWNRLMSGSNPNDSSTAVATSATTGPARVMPASAARPTSGEGADERGAPTELVPPGDRAVAIDHGRGGLAGR